MDKTKTVCLIATSIGKNGFFHHGAVIWNSLLPALLIVNVLSNFKSLYIKVVC